MPPKRYSNEERLILAIEELALVREFYIKEKKYKISEIDSFLDEIQYPPGVDRPKYPK